MLLGTTLIPQLATLFS
ncbi:MULTISPECIES: hypothetical protein [Clostridia]|nr:MULTISPECIES: hypothetical protein [Clostridia]MCF7628846.1 hypothetical protein [[Ruminococcus] lactaris]MCG4821633.1 hypothetical protein [Eubacterium callanderi]MCH3944551.1 hypothetical protein [Lachnospiraceae bacterium]MCI7448182.1 hypothetical protein [Blautia sp.]MCU6695107.1 hypothetical protein [Hoministercoradaptatus ammoniilyticus]MDB8010587.1 hypothetical protein [Agathobacter rectalis]